VATDTPVAAKGSKAAGPKITKRRVRALSARLKSRQGALNKKPRLPIVDELIATVISQHTSDINTARAFSSLKKRFPSWHDVVYAPTSEVADAIRAGGLANTKAPRIQRILLEIENREGSIDLASLNIRSDEEATQYLVSLPGVGPKTAACVLLFSMGRDAFPVDTHVHRVAERLGLIPARTNAQRAHLLLTELVPAELRYEFHMQLIQHGRGVCKSARPMCSECVLFDLCEMGPALVARGDAR
jgi:endonuclease III